MEAKDKVNKDELNISGQLNLLLNNVPSNVSELEKVRWLYIKAGELFCYDYELGADPNYESTTPSLDDSFINRNQVCGEISYLFKQLINKALPNTKCNVIPRTIQVRNIFGNEHRANGIILSNGEKYILDLTLDLYLIQSGCKTKQFGYATDMYSDYDIISLPQCAKMDENLGLIKNGEYTDLKINNLSEELEKKDYSNMDDEEIIEYRIKKMQPLLKTFTGILEAKQYMNKLMNSLLPYQYTEFNFTYKDEYKNEICTCFVINSEPKKWYLFNKDIGLIRTFPEIVNEMLNNGWNTKSNLIYEVLNQEENRTR